MSPYTIMQVDAFTDRPLGGNPCAVVFDSDPLDAPTMQAIAQEMNLSETAFLRTSKVADFGARYFTPSEEIPMAGHPTIATIFALIVSGRLEVPQSGHTLSLELPVGPIRVDVHFHDGHPVITMTQKKPQFGDPIPHELVLPAFGLETADGLPGFSPRVVSTGTPQLMVPLRDHEALKRAALNIPEYLELKGRFPHFSPHLFCLGGATEDGDTFSRHLGVPPDTPEDPFTGSATGGMAAYLWHHGLLESAEFVAEQGHWMGRPGTAQVSVLGSREEPEAVRVGGRAALIMKGELYL